MKKIICLVMAYVMMVCMFSSAAFAVDNASNMVVEDSAEQKIYSSATIDDDFADNRVMVVLNNEASLKFRDYTLSDFSEIKCRELRDLSQATKVKMNEKVEILKAAAVSRSVDLQTLDTDGIDTYNQVLCIELENSGKENVLAAINELQQRDDVLYAGPDYMISICSEETEDTYVDEQWALDTIQLPEAWDVTTGSSSVKVGIIDSGIDGDHPDLEGKVHLYDSWDFTLGEDVNIIPTDPNGHGTHVAGIIGAIANNSEGVMGAAYNVIFASLRVFDTNGNGYASNLALAIEYAGQNNIPILNFSGRWYEGNSYYDFALANVIENYPGLFVCAAGNELRDNDTVDIYPANDRYLNTITVGASTSENKRWYDFPYGSNYGDNSVDIFAPGDGIISCYPTASCEKHSCSTPGYHVMTGTSMATPYVTAVAALMLSENPDLTPIQIRQRILGSCDQYDALSGYCITGGVVNAYRAVLNAYTPTVISLNSNITTYISEGAHRWYVFTAPSNGTYAFYTEGSLDVYGELFSETTGLLQYCDDMYNPDEGAESNYNFYISQYLCAGEKVYLRVTVVDPLAQGTYSLKVAS